jgi:hypothetical protein
MRDELQRPRLPPRTSAGYRLLGARERAIDAARGLRERRRGRRHGRQLELLSHDSSHRPHPSGAVGVLPGAWRRLPRAGDRDSALTPSP